MQVFGPENSASNSGTDLTWSANEYKLYSYVRIISTRRLDEFARLHARARSSLEIWEDIVSSGSWTTFAELRRTFGSTDTVRVASGRNVVVFNLAGNNFRLICAVHYNLQTLFVLRFMSHAEYSKAQWKADL